MTDDTKTTPTPLGIQKIRLEAQLLELAKTTPDWRAIVEETTADVVVRLNADS